MHQTLGPHVQINLPQALAEHWLDDDYQSTNNTLYTPYKAWGQLQLS
jgi:hypothetical protein